MLKTAALATLVVAALALTGCGRFQRGLPAEFTQHLIGPPVGVVALEALTAEAGWRVVAPLTGVAAGTLVARREATGDCAYLQADGSYRVLRCG